MKKYIVKNCPALNLPLFEDYEEPAIKNGCMQEETGCEEISNCLIKQIVELCKEPFNNFDLDDTRIQDKKFYAHLLLMPILKLLEIEEVE